MSVSGHTMSRHAGSMEDRHQRCRCAFLSIIICWLAVNTLLLAVQATTISARRHDHHPPADVQAWHAAGGLSGHSHWMSRRRQTLSCPDPNPFIAISHDASTALKDRQNVTVTVTGVVEPSDGDWIAVISPSSSDIGTCLQNEVMYVETGDFASLPLLCHYPVKFQSLTEDPAYLACSNWVCSKHWGLSPSSGCLLRTCSGSLTFDLINIRTDLKFVFFTGGFETPCILAQTGPLSFANPKQPLYGHLSSLDSTGTSIKLTWVSGDSQPQTVQYADGKSVQSAVTTFHKSDMCNQIQSPASDFGWHDPGFIHSAILTGLSASTKYNYTYGSDQAGWSPTKLLKTLPASSSPEVKFIIYGDMGKTPRDNCIEHYIQPGALSVVNVVSTEVASGNVDLILHIGDISYATGFLAEWDYFLDLISPVASEIPYMTAIGNHERDFPDPGSLYETPDSGGECGVAYEKYFQMPTQEQDKPWYSFEAGPVHFTVMSTEHSWINGSEQFNWIQHDLASVNRTRTPWLVFTGHRPQYSSVSEDGVLSRILPSVDPAFPPAVEPLLMQGQVDLVFWGHVHNYERSCAVYQSSCLLRPSKDANGVDTYQSRPYKAPVHVIVGMAGFTLDGFTPTPGNWSLARFSTYGYGKVDATFQELLFQFISADGGHMLDSFKLLK